MFSHLEGVIIWSVKIASLKELIPWGPGGTGQIYNFYSMQSNKFKFGMQLLPLFSFLLSPSFSFFPPPQSFINIHSKGIPTRSCLQRRLDGMPVQFCRLPHQFAITYFILLGGKRHYESKVSYPRRQCSALIRVYSQTK